jgi:hypothetical protein
MPSTFATRMRDFYEGGGFDIVVEGRPMRYKYIAAVMITHVYINESLQYEPFVKYMTRTLSDNNIVDFDHRAKPLKTHESDGVIFLTLKYPSQAIRVIDIFDEKFFGDSATIGKILTCKPNGFTNSGCVADYMTERYRPQIDSVMRFNERWYERVANTNYNWLPPASANRVYYARRQNDSYDNNYINTNLQRRLNFDNNYYGSSRNHRIRNNNEYDDNLNYSTAQGQNTATISVKAEHNNNVSVSVQMRNDDGNQDNATTSKKRKLSIPRSSVSPSKKIDVSNVKVESNDDDDCVLIEHLSVVDKAKHELENHMGSQPFDCARCGMRLIGSEVIGHRCKVPPLDESNPGFGFYS